MKRLYEYRAEDIAQVCKGMPWNQYAYDGELYKHFILNGTVSKCGQYLGICSPDKITDEFTGQGWPIAGKEKEIFIQLRNGDHVWKDEEIIALEECMHNHFNPVIVERESRLNYVDTE